jgi:hypothetical protein
VNPASSAISTSANEGKNTVGVVVGVFVGVIVGVSVGCGVSVGSGVGVFVWVGMGVSVAVGWLVAVEVGGMLAVSCPLQATIKTAINAMKMSDIIFFTISSPTSTGPGLGYAKLVVTLLLYILHITFLKQE